MYELELDKAKLKTIRDHRYYVFSPTPSTHKTKKIGPPSTRIRKN